MLFGEALRRVLKQHVSSVTTSSILVVSHSYATGNMVTQANLTAIAFVDCRQEKCTAALIKQHRHRQWRTRQLNLYSGDQNQ